MMPLHGVMWDGHCSVLPSHPHPLLSSLHLPPGVLGSVLEDW